MHPKNHKVCIKVPKVYDWVQRQIDIPLIRFDNKDLDDLFEKKHDHCSTKVCKFLEKYPGFQVHCEFIEDSILCQEIVQYPIRQEVTVQLPNRQQVTLQKVKVLVKGLVKVTILDSNDKILLVSDDIAFATIQTFFLCAPQGTKLHCKVTYLQCDSDIICTDDFEQLDISIQLCLDVQMETDVKLEIRAATCIPRLELPTEDVLCPTKDFPTQCPNIFPSRENHPT